MDDDLLHERRRLVTAVIECEHSIATCLRRVQEYEAELHREARVQHMYPDPSYIRELHAWIDDLENVDIPRLRRRLHQLTTRLEEVRALTNTTSGGGGGSTTK